MVGMRLSMPATAQEVEAARQRFVAWLKWYMRNHPDDCGTQLAIAPKLGVTQGNVSAWFRPGSKRLPGFATLLSIKKLLGVPLDVMLGTEPPV